jgi:hypothetical protein
MRGCGRITALRKEASSMDSITNTIIAHLKSINFEGPAMFVIAFLALLGYFRRWSILLLSLLVIVLGWGARDLIILNIKSQSAMISLPLIIYGIGGLLILFLVLISFYKS